MTFKKASQKTKEGAALADAPDPELQVEYQADYKKSKFVAETDKRKSTAAEMFHFYASLLSLDVKYAWNKIVKEQQRLIHSRIFKACPGKAQGDFCASHSMTV